MEGIILTYDKLVDESQPTSSAYGVSLLVGMGSSSCLRMPEMAEEDIMGSF